MSLTLNVYIFLLFSASNITEIYCSVLYLNPDAQIRICSKQPRKKSLGLHGRGRHGEADMGEVDTGEAGGRAGGRGSGQVT